MSPLTGLSKIRAALLQRYRPERGCHGHLPAHFPTCSPAHFPTPSLPRGPRPSLTLPAPSPKDIGLRASSTMNHQTRVYNDVFEMMPIEENPSPLRAHHSQFRFAVHILWSREPELWTLGFMNALVKILPLLALLLGGCVYRDTHQKVSASEVQQHIIGTWWCDHYSPDGPFYRITFHPNGRWTCASTNIPLERTREAYWRVTTNGMLLVTKTRRHYHRAIWKCLCRTASLRVGWFLASRA